MRLNTKRYECVNTVSYSVARPREIPKIAHGRVRSCSGGKGALIIHSRYDNLHY